MQGSWKRIVSFANFYNQLKIPVLVISSFVKWAPEAYGLVSILTTKFLFQSDATILTFDLLPWKQLGSLSNHGDLVYLIVWS
jgi:hypothetical protein